MKQVIIFHGGSGRDEYFSSKYPSLSNSHWYPWLQKHLLINNIEAHTPEVFEAYKRQRSQWQREIERYEIDEQTSLVGHSTGAGFLLRWLSESKDVKVDTVVLVAPWLDPFKEENTDMFDFELDSGLVERTKRVMVFFSDDDMKSVGKTVEILKDKLSGVQFKELKDRGHFTYDDLGTDEFPELLEELIHDSA